MSNINDLLNFHVSHFALSNAAQKIIPVTLKNQNDFKIDKLDRLTEKLGASTFDLKMDNLISQVFRKFKTINSTNIESFSKRELRTLTYTLKHSENSLTPIFYDQYELACALKMLESNWRDSYLFGLIYCLLTSWEEKDTESFTILSDFILNKLYTYEGSRSTLLGFKSNLRFFNPENGDVILGTELALRNKSISDSAKYLSLPNSWIAFPYFSKVIIAYYEKKKDELSEIIDHFENVLPLYRNASRDKRVISKLINQANQPSFFSYQDRIKNLAFDLIGDPENLGAWSPFVNFTERERAELLNGRRILNEWITKQFINVFFNVCINDERRKRFWLKYASKISTFKVYGPKSTKMELRKDDRISKVIESRYVTVLSNREISAFILYIGNYMIIEFSNDGFACCAYKLNSSNMPKLSARLNSVEDLRNSALPPAVESDSKYYYFNEEGRLFHKGEWEPRFDNWLTKKALQ